MIVLGYNGFSRIADVFARLFGYTQDSVNRHCFRGHDAAAALFVDGVLVAAIEEERLDRRKKTSAFPINAIEWCLDHAGLTYADVDRVAFPWDFTDDYADHALTDIAGSPASVRDKLRAISCLGLLYTGIYSRDAVREDFARATGFDLPDERLVSVRHHHAHLGCGRVVSGLDDAAFLISDGQAEEDSAILGEVSGGRVSLFDDLTIAASDSIAQLYGMVTKYLGFVPNCDEYKVMGLAAYGSPPGESNPLMRDVVELADDGRYGLSMAGDPRGFEAYLSIFDDVFGGDEHARRTFDFRVRVAAAAQEMIEVVTAHQLRALLRRTELRTLLVEGGLALNCVNNTKLLELLPVDRLEVSFGASDPGVSIGAAAHVVQQLGSTPTSSTPFLGRAYDDAEIHAALDERRDEISFTEHPGEAIVEVTASLLVDPVVLGWFQGRNEFGPRALGHRSILANPSYAEMRDVINVRIKHREEFRPFAPMVLESDAGEVFAMGKKTSSPYMTFVFTVAVAYRDTIPSALHVDGTARIQTVSDSSDPRMAALLRTFKAKTGVPCLINTSFNVAGEPIVQSPADALRCFLSTDMDYLVMGDTLVEKRR